MHHIARRNPESLERAFESFQKATELDPTFALGWAGLSSAYIERDVWAGLGVGRHADAARTAALEAIRLEPDLADAHRSLAAVKFQVPIGTGPERRPATSKRSN